MSTLTVSAIEEPIPYAAIGPFAPPATSAPDRVLPSLIDEPTGYRRIWLGVALLICGLYAFSILSFWAPADGGVDQNAYLVGGRMIASHFTTRFDPPDPFAYIGNMFDRSAAGKFYPKYPFGLPLLYAITIWILGPAKALTGAFLVSPVCAILAVLGTFFLARLIAGSFAAVMAAILLATSQVMLELANNANSHASCVAFIVWGMYALVRWWQTDQGWKHHVLGVLGGFLIGYAGVIRYSEGLLVLPIAVACASRLRWKDWRSYLRSAIPGLAWAVPIAAMLIYNKLSLGDWTGYDSTSESAFGAAFTWTKFVATWEEMLRVMHDMGLFFVLPFGVAGLAMLFRRNWKLALMLVMWALPGVALYTSYYWSPERGIAYGRFFLTFFPAFLVGAAVCFRDGILGGVKSDEHPARKIPMCIAIGLVVAISSGVGLYRSIQGMESGARGASEDLGDQLRNRANLAMTGKTIFKEVPEGSVLFTEQGGMGNSPINYLQFIQNWNLFSIDAFSPTGGRRGVGGRGPGGPGGGPPGGFGRQGGQGANGAVTQDTPSPMQPRLREYFASIYKDKSSADLLKEQRRVVDDALASGKRVFAAVTPLHLQTFKTSLASDSKSAPKYDFKRIAQWRDMPAPTPETPVAPNGGGGFGGRRGGFGGNGGPGGGRMAMMERGQALSWTLVEITLAK